MTHISTIRAFQKILTTYKFSEPSSFPEEFAQKRFLKKMELPDSQNISIRKQKCFTDWRDFDESLKLPSLLPGNWYKARLLIHKMCEEFALAPVVFTNGSEASPTHGFNSIESKLMRSRWECTPDCWNLWARTAYETLAIKRATRTRFSAVMGHNHKLINLFHKESYRHFREQKNYKFLCFSRMLSYVTYVRDASRFSTVRKNNEKDRPIDLQPLCNMLVQRRVGNGLRNMLKACHGVDLDHLAFKHRELIRNRSKATIDLKNASDSIHLDLVRFLFPKKVFDSIIQSRTYYTEGLDGHYYVTRKVSSMGNGFTFELMTVIIRALGLQFDESFSVFGDDIIIENRFARSLIEDLKAVGFVVNDDKSFIDSPFRESCGGNYHDDFGYIESYDFEYPETIHDCVVISNKAFALRRYPTFDKLSKLLLRAVPRALHGPAFVFDETGRQGYDSPVKLSTTFWSNKPERNCWDNNLAKNRLRELCYNPDEFYLVTGFVYKPKTASNATRLIRMRKHTGKYFMYLNACRITNDYVDDRGSWQEVSYVSNGQAFFRLKSLLSY